jgi:hypothetical protein
MDLSQIDAEHAVQRGPDVEGGRVCQSALKFGSDACLMTASRIMLHRAIVLREGQFSRAHTFVV